MLLQAESSWARRLAALVESEYKGGVVIIGMGHPLRGDDYVGSLVARDLRESLKKDGRVLVIDAGHSPENFVHVLEKTEPSLVVYVDSLEAQLPPGSTTLVDLNQTSYAFFTSHGIPIKVLLSTLPYRPRAVLLGIQPKSSEVDESLSPEVNQARTIVVRELTKIMEAKASERTAS